MARNGKRTPRRGAGKKTAGRGRIKARKTTAGRTRRPRATTPEQAFAMGYEGSRSEEGTRSGMPRRRNRSR